MKTRFSHPRVRAAVIVAGLLALLVGGNALYAALNNVPDGGPDGSAPQTTEGDSSGSSAFDRVPDSTQ